jgi:uncharacterized phage protein gp47/JayE
MAGLTDAGFDIKPLETIISELEADIKTALGDADLNTEADSALGQIIRTFAARLFSQWELGEELYQAAYADTATGQALSYIAALTGTIRSPATKATVDVECTFTGTPTLPAGTAVYVEGDPDSRFELLEDYALTSSPEVVTFTASIAGTYPTATTGDTCVIETPVVGWTAATFDANSVDGTEEETDDELRVRREQELARPGTGTVDAIRTDVLDVAGITSCTVFENATGEEDDDGLPAHAIEVMVTGSYTAQTLVDQIFASKPAGTQTYGSLSGTATDDAGNTHTVYYSEPTERTIYVAVTLTEGADYVGDAAVKTAIEEWAADLELGESIYASDIVSLVADLAGVEWVDLTATFVEVDDATPDQLVWTAGSRELGTIVAANVTVTSV